MASIVRPSLLRQTVRRASPAVRSAVLKDVARVSAFHASSRKNLLPPGPQVIKGTVNDPAPVPTPSPSHGSYHWTFDRLLAAGLVPLTVAPFAAGSLNPVLDATLVGAILIHSHTGFQNILIDYIPNGRFPKSRKFSMWALNAATVLVGIGLYEFETNDVGVTEAIKRVWKA
ncbi:membrane anchor subunit of succinate dehydrogenase, Sdh4 [Neopestalotiopsis sp. 37M]|nr:membrane anchor subunit of succinate dehydrogenase, Sdh4 [Neopestalotiopsis sp. 37M]